MTYLFRQIPIKLMEEVLAYLGGLYGLFLQTLPSLTKIESVFSIAALAVAIIVGIHRLIDYHTDEQKFSDN